MSRTTAVRFWVITLVAALSVLLTAALGLWQLGRAQQKRALEDLIAARSALPEWRNQSLLDSPQREDHLHRPVRLSGQWVQGATLFLDNRPMGGRTGFIVLTPLRLTGSEHAVLVQRGWVPRDFQDRQRLPEVTTPAGDVELQGRLALPPSQLFELGAGVQGPIRQNVELSALGREWGIPLLAGVSIQQTGPVETQLLREWPRFVGDEHKHLAYAAQWFAMCAGVAILYIWFQIIQPRLKRRPHGQAS
jgi:surfeit locus 1 family protein